MKHKLLSSLFSVSFMLSLTNTCLEPELLEEEEGEEGRKERKREHASCVSLLIAFLPASKSALKREKSLPSSFSPVTRQVIPQTKTVVTINPEPLQAASLVKMHTKV